MGGSLADTDTCGHELVTRQLTCPNTERMTDGAFRRSSHFPLVVEGMRVRLARIRRRETAMWCALGAEREATARAGPGETGIPFLPGGTRLVYVGAKGGRQGVASLLRSSAISQHLTGFAFAARTTPDELNRGWHPAMQEATAALEADRPSLTSGASRQSRGRAGPVDVGPK